MISGQSFPRCRWALAGAVCALLACGGSLRETCGAVAVPGTWHVVGTLVSSFGTPGPCPAIDLTVTVPQSTGDSQAVVTFVPATSELGSRDECFIRYVQGTPATGGRTGCLGVFDGGSATGTQDGSCLFQVGPPDAYGDFSSSCSYTAVWQRVQ